MSKTAREAQEQDDEILASILAGTATSNRKLEAGMGWITPRVRVDEPQYVGTCCAIGAGALYAGIDRGTLLAHPHEAIGAFAEKYGVSLAYAAGISDGFETGRTGHPQASSGSWEYREHPDYLRGYTVGAAVRCSQDEVDSVEEMRAS